MGLVNIILGLVLLVFGWKLFWLFVAIAGFLVGMALSSALLADQPQWLILCVALGAGLVGAIVAVLAERVAFALAGFYAGSYAALIAAQSLGAESQSIFWFVFGGIIGGVFATLIMDWAIITLSCLVGAEAIVQSLPLGQAGSLILFVVLMVSGVLLQRQLMVRSQTG